MQAVISKLIDELKKANIDFDAEDIADGVLLAAYKYQYSKQNNSELSALNSTPAIERKNDLPDTTPPTQPDKDESSSVAQKIKKTSTEPSITEEQSKPNDPAANLVSPSIGDDSVSSITASLPFHTPAAHALPHSLQLARNLRPLTRRVASNYAVEIDEKATAQQIADSDSKIWLPVLRPKLERWLELALVIEDSATMRLWHHTIKEWRFLLEKQGAFSDVRVWKLKTQAKNQDISLHSQSNAGFRHYKELINPARQRLILVVTDCISPAWQSETLIDWLNEWGKYHSVSLINMLPQQLWSQTRLRYARLVRLNNQQPATANRYLQQKQRIPLWQSKEEKNTSTKKSIAIPLTTLEPDFLKTWAKFVTGHGDVLMPGFIFESQPILETSLTESITIDENQRFNQFRSVASPTAFQLACYLAAAPLCLPVMRLVQQVMLPQSEQVHLAEVFLSGLLKRVSVNIEKCHSDEIEYDFLSEQIRDCFLKAGLFTDAIIVQEHVSDYIAEHYGSPLDFRAMLLDPNAEANKLALVELGDKNRIFAKVTAHILKRLGGKYETLANTLENPKPISILKNVSQLISENKRSRSISLNLSDCGLTSIPTEISEFTWLQEIVLNKNPITDITLLSKLKDLHTIDIAATQITDISPLINLINLNILDASFTQISNLNPIAVLHNLQQLDISFTQVSDISPLKYIIENGIQVEWTHNNYKTKGIYVKDCNLTIPPIEIVNLGHEAIIAYLRELDLQGVDHLYEANLFIVGNGGVGKTSLVRRLFQQEKGFSEAIETTKGIDIYRHSFMTQDSRHSSGREFRLNVWDFGGQEIFHATHQLFFTQRSIYILVDDSRTIDKTVHDRNFKYWLETIDLLSNHSPVLIFQNEKGGRSKQIDLAGIKSRFPNVKDYYAGNLELKNSADKLRDALEFYAKQLPHIGEELPTKWISIRAEIEQLAELRRTISLDEYFRLYEKHLPFSRDNALYFSRYFHDLGVLLHFQDDEILCRTMILRSTWATYALYKMLDDETVKAKLGRFTLADCRRVWQDSDYAELQPELRALMEKFELCYLLPDSNPKTWLMPQLLPAFKPIELNDWEKAGDLVLRYKYDFLPKGMINRLMVRKHYLIPRPELAWLTGVLFERNGTQVLVELSERNDEIVFRARGTERKELLSIIVADLEAINDTFKGLSEKVRVLIPCICSLCRTNPEPEFYEQRRLFQRKQNHKTTIECPASFEDVSISKLLDLDTEDETKENKKFRIYISYSYRDKEYKNKLLKHLETLRDRVIIFHDEDLMPGDDRDARFKNELSNADIVLYFVSTNSLASDYIQNIELPLTYQCLIDKKCTLIPIIIDFCNWQEMWFSKYLALPKNAVPITNIDYWVSEDQAWINVIEGIDRVLKTIDDKSLKQPILSLGSKGEEVTKIQMALGIEADGIYGLQTRAKVKEWQALNGLESDGIFGEKSWAVLLKVGNTQSEYPLLSIGSRGKQVKRIQEILDVTVDGIYGKATEIKVKEWQARYGLIPDGIFGEKSWAILLKLENPQEALRYFQQKLQIAYNLSDTTKQADTLGDLGLVYKELGDFESALKYYQQQLQIARQIVDKKLEAYILHIISVVYYQLGKINDARKMAEMAFKICKRIKSPLVSEITQNLKNWK